MLQKKVLVLLSGCGVYDGSEIHESVLCLLALDIHKISVQCTAPDDHQHHVINHLNGEEMSEERNMLTESARIARGNIRPSYTVGMSEYDGLVIPGGFGAAKNLSNWAFDGPKGTLHPEAGRLIREAHMAGKPIAAFCMSPVVIALALQNTHPVPKLTVGSAVLPSPYDIAAISSGMQFLGTQPEMCPVTEFIADTPNKIITSPCYMMEAGIGQVYDGILKAITAFVGWL